MTSPGLAGARRPATADAWVVAGPPRGTVELRLFCFPYAGGGASVFRGWAADLPPGIELCAVQLPGREGRLREAPFRRMDDLLPELEAGLAHRFDLPFAFFGHSLGAAIAYALADRLAGSGKPLRHLTVSARPAPDRPHAEPRMYDLPEPELVAALRRLGGTPEEVLAHPELMALLLPLLRADFEISQTYRIERRPLDVPILAIGGASDPLVPESAIAEWSGWTRSRFRHVTFAGGHLYLQEQRRQLLATLVRELARSDG